MMKVALVTPFSSAFLLASMTAASANHEQVTQEQEQP
jgi:hypothetical protein